MIYKNITLLLSHYIILVNWIREYYILCCEHWAVASVYLNLKNNVNVHSVVYDEEGSSMSGRCKSKYEKEKALWIIGPNGKVDRERWW